jgi:hypothetical protein
LKVHSRLPRTMSFEALARLVMIPSLFIWVIKTKNFSVSLTTTALRFSSSSICSSQEIRNLTKRRILSSRILFAWPSPRWCAFRTCMMISTELLAWLVIMKLIFLPVSQNHGRKLGKWEAGSTQLWMSFSSH